VMQVLRDTNWILGGASGAAARLGIPRTTLIYRMRRLGIERPED
jgi:formate hydrogenlyase transcriptional activator